MRYAIGILLVFLHLSAGTSGAEEMKESHQKATFAGGCFWGIEKYFSEMKGIMSTRVGYTGGTVQNPTYEEVCAGGTGHAEAIEIAYDPSLVSYEELLEFFFRLHDPTTKNSQGPDVGSQYRSAIFYHKDAQKKAAERAVKLLNDSHIFRQPIVTEIEPAGEFYAAEEYHQKYLEQNPGGYCSIHLESGRISEILRAVSK